MSEQTDPQPTSGPAEAPSHHHTETEPASNGDTTAAGKVCEDGVDGTSAATLKKEYYCGCGPWHPPWLQVFRDARVFTVLLCLYSTIEGALVSGFTSVILSSIERRYQLTSTAVGAIASTFDVSVLVSVIFISYFGGRGHKPRWLGVSLIIQGVGAFVFALPQFLFGQYEVGSTGTLDIETCSDGYDFSSDCSSANNFAYSFFLIGNILIGVGAAPLFTIGTSYLDEIVHPKHVSIYLGIFYMLSVVGPALGYALGGLFLSIYVDPWVDTHLETSDPGWVGAWWMCFLFCSVASFAIAIPFFCYPRLLPNSDEVRALREEEMAKKSMLNPSDETDNGVKELVKEFLLQVMRLFTNPSWLFISTAIAIGYIIIAGFASFGPKYIESQFDLSASSASLILGVVAIPTGGAGVVSGGLLIYFLKIKGRHVVLFNLIVSVIIMLPLFGLLVHCETFDLAGVTVSYFDGTDNVAHTSDLFSNCTVPCNCTSSVFQPVCGSDNIVYFTPCHAGCFPGDEADFENCTCVADQVFSQSSSSSYSDVLTSNSTASNGLCDRGCGGKLGLFLAMIGLSLFLVFMLQIPNIIITIRCVAEEQRTLALGVQSFMFRLFGSIPGPLLFGVIFDSTCVFWQRNCGKQGNCWLYDNTALSNGAVVLAEFAILGNVVFSFLCWLMYPRRDVGSVGKTKEGGTTGYSTDRTREDMTVTEVEEQTSLQGEGIFQVEEIFLDETSTGQEFGNESPKVRHGSESGTSVIGEMQTRNSTSQLLVIDELDGVGFNKNLSSAPIEENTSSIL